MLQVNTSVSSVPAKVKPVFQGSLLRSQSLKPAITSDTFQKATQNEIKFTGLLDIFKVPRVIRKNPEIKALCEQTIAGKLEALEKIENNSELKPKELKAIKSYLTDKVFNSCLKELSSDKAQILVKLNAVPGITRNLVEARAAIKNLDKDNFSRIPNWNWYKELSNARKAEENNSTVLESVLDKSNPLQAEAVQQQLSFITAFIEKEGPVVFEDKLNSYAKVYALDMLKKAPVSQKELDSLLKVLNNRFTMPERVRTKVAQVIPSVANRVKPETAVKEQIVSDLNKVIKSTDNYELKVACYEAIEALEK